MKTEQTLAPNGPPTENLRHLGKEWEPSLSDPDTV
jgi:hypothetical protein